MDPNVILIWAQVGQQLVQIGTAAYENLESALQAHGIQADQSQLAKLRELYDERIARRESEGGDGGRNGTTGE